MKPKLVIAILIVCVLTGAAVMFMFPTQQPSSTITVRATEPQQADNETSTEPLLPVIPFPTQPQRPVQTNPPAAVTTVAPDTPDAATAPDDTIATEGSQEVALLPDPTVPLPPRRPQLAPDEPQPELSMSQVRKGSPVFIRIFKKENVLELWVHHEDRFRFVKKYPICAWSGALGPKIQVGDRQAPEGFYAVTKKQLNPKSSYYRAFNVGFPNAYDSQLGRTGSALMVHGACASAGCYAMTDRAIAEIYPIVEAALGAGQKAVAVHIFPFRMTETALKAQARSPWYGFWNNLKVGYDQFEKTRTPPTAFACKGRYVLDEKEASQSGCQKISGWL